MRGSTAPASARRRRRSLREDDEPRDERGGRGRPPRRRARSASPACSASGAARAAGTAVLTPTMHAYTAVSRATRSGKYRRTTDGSSTLPMPVPANATTLPTSSTAKPGANARTRWPAVMSTSASTTPPSSPEPAGDARRDEPGGREQHRRQRAEQPDVEVRDREVHPDGAEDRRDRRDRLAQREAPRARCPAARFVRPAHSGRRRASGTRRAYRADGAGARLSAPRAPRRSPCRSPRPPAWRRARS